MMLRVRMASMLFVETVTAVVQVKIRQLDHHLVMPSLFLPNHFLQHADKTRVEGVERQVVLSSSGFILLGVVMIGGTAATKALSWTLAMGPNRFHFSRSRGFLTVLVLPLMGPSHV